MSEDMNFGLWVVMIFHSAIAFGNSTDLTQGPETSVIKETRALTDEEQPFHYKDQFKQNIPKENKE